MPVYIIRAGKRGPVKIGWSMDPLQRVDAMQTANGEPIRLLGVIDGDVGTEKELHKRYKALRLRGEWFRFCPTMLDLLAPPPNRPQRSGYYSALAKYRRSLGLTLDELAEKWQLSRSTLHSWESGQRVPKLSMIFMIKTLSGGKIKPEDFVNGDAA